MKTQKQRILAQLRLNPTGLTNGDLMFTLYITCPHKRIAEIEADGYRIDRDKRWHEGSRRWLTVYRLIEDQK